MGKYLLKSVRSFVHNILMVGSPGAGKTLLARAMPGILPEISIDESLDVTRIYSVADQLPAGTPLIRHRPFRAPHHTISHAGLVGGGNIPKPGEISLAHRAVLFLDEFPEFGTRILEVMRQPMEDRVVTISRAKGSLTFSANFQLIAAMNPCPCGYYGDSLKPCTCAHALVTKYQKRISGPLLDRIDIHIEVPRVDYEKLSGDRIGESSESIRTRVQAARDIQLKRFWNNRSSDIVCNADMRVGRYASSASFLRRVKASCVWRHRVKAIWKTTSLLLSSSPTSALLRYPTGTSETEILAIVRYMAEAIRDPVTRGGTDTLITAHPRAASKNPLFP
jgi:Mg chelatase-like protein